NIFTIVLDGARFLPRQFETFSQLKIPWRWSICEGVALPVNDTAWCKPIFPRLSNDGTGELLQGYAKYPNISVQQNSAWPGKTNMVNTALLCFEKPGTLLQVDADEFWSTEQLEAIDDLFDPDTRIAAA